MDAGTPAWEMGVAKYDALSDWLRSHSGAVMVSFDELSAVVAGGLPPSAWEYREWWANTSANPQGRGWIDAGRTVVSVSLERERVEFSEPQAMSRDQGSEERALVGSEVPFADKAWHWEGNVQAMVVRHLESDGWEIVSTADTAAREAGVDILAARGDSRLAVEVKGYPSEVYARGPRAGQRKRTRPATQARHWYAGALLTTMLTRSSLPDHRLVIALPDFPTYVALLERTSGSLFDMGIGVLVVSESGTVRSFPTDASK